MSWTKADVERLEKAIVSGHRKVKYADKEVEYQSTGDMLKALDVAKTALAAKAKRKMVSTGYFDGT